MYEIEIDGGVTVVQAYRTPMAQLSCLDPAGSHRKPETVRLWARTEGIGARVSGEIDLPWEIRGDMIWVALTHRHDRPATLCALKVYWTDGSESKTDSFPWIALHGLVPFQDG